jgi:hypothetical protein
MTDQAWLDSINKVRAKDGNSVSSETFEIIFDKLEKEWFDLVSSSSSFPLKSAANAKSVIDQEYTEESECTSE